MKRITVTVDPDDYAAVSALARQGDVTVSWLIRRWMRDFLERHERDGTIALTITDSRTASKGGA